MNTQPNSSAYRFWTAFLAVVAFCVGLTAVAGEPPGDLFRDRVAPLLAAKCGACHGPEDAESGFRVDVREQAVEGGDSGSVGIVPGDPDESKLFVRVSTDEKELRMPADSEPLSADERRLLRDWIAAGAVWPDDMRSLAALLPEAGPKPAKGKNHWALHPLTRPPVPPAPHGTGPIDAFLMEKLAAGGLEMNPEADPRTRTTRRESRGRN